MILVRTPLRISFVGGGSDVPAHFNEYGGAVVSATINKYIYITAKENNLSLFPAKYRLVYSRVEECNSIEEVQHPIIKALLNQYSVSNLDLDVMSDIPAGTGLGSSSAFTVGLHKALMHLELLPTLSKSLLARRAINTEIRDLKEPIGVQDQCAAAFGGLNHFHFVPGDGIIPTPILIPSWSRFKDKLHLYYIGGTRSASSMLRDQIRPENTQVLRDMAGLAGDLAHDLRYGNIENTGFYIKEGWRLKKELSPNVSTPKVDELIELIEKQGGAGKLLGAGGAGFVLAWLPNGWLDRAPGLREIPFQFDLEGSKALYVD